MALELVYESYRDLNIVAENSHRMRVTKYHTMPTTAVLIAKNEITGEVIATMSVVTDSPLGLPLEDLWSIEHLRTKSRRIAEISSLAIKRSYRSKHGDILFPLCKYMYHLSKEHLGIDLLVASVHPMVKDLYTCIFPFRSIDNRVHTYDFVQGAKAVGLYLNINGQGEKDLERQWGNQPTKYNYYQYLTSPGGEGFHFPDGGGKDVARYILTPEQLEYLFQECSSVFSSLSPNQRLALVNTYHTKQYRNILNRNTEIPILSSRREPRFVLNLRCRILMKDTIIPATVLDGSLYGLRIYLEHGMGTRLASGDLFHISVRLSSKESTSLSCRATWTSTDKSLVGIQITQQAPEEWLTYISTMENDLHLISGSNPKLTKVSTGEQ